MEKVYVLDVRVPKQENQRIEVLNEIHLGSDERCDLRINDHGLAPLQGRFRLQNGVLTFTHLGPDKSFKIGRHKCGHGRMYILSPGDKCSVEKVHIIVSEEELPENKLMEEELEDLDEELEEEILEEMEEEAPQESEPPSDSTNPTIIAQDLTDPNLDEADSDENEEEEDEGEGEDEGEFEYVEEEVYVDEDGNEVEAPKPLKKEGFFSRLKNKFKKSEEDKEEKAAKKLPPAKPKKHDLGLKGKKTKPAPKNQLAGPLARFIGLCYNFLFFYLFLYALIPGLEHSFEVKIAPISSEVFKSLSPLLEKLPEKLPTEVASLPYASEAFVFLKESVLKEKVFHVVFFFLVYELFFQFVLGLSFGQFMIGIKNNGRGLVTRILSPLRVMLGWLLLPFLIFDFPILLKKRSFKELITGARITVRKKRITFLLSLFVVPAMVLAAVNYQILIDLNGSLMDSFSLNRGKAPKIASKFNEDKFSYRSQAFAIQGMAFLDSRIKFIPSLKLQGSKLYPSLTISTPQNNSIVTVTRKEKVFKVEEILEICRQDPLFHVYQQGITDDDSELMSFFYKILAINLKNIPKAIKDFGPFVGPYYQAAKILRDHLGAKDLKEVNLYASQKRKTLQTISVVNRDTVILSILKLNGEYLDFLIGSSDKKHEPFLRDIFVKTFFDAGLYEGKIEDVFKVIKEDKLEDIRTMGLAAQDLLYQISMGKNITREQAKMITEVFKVISQDSILAEDENLQLYILELFEDLDKALLKANTKKKDKILSELRLGLASIQKALNSRDPMFFEINR